MFLKCDDCSHSRSVLLQYEGRVLCSYCKGRRERFADLESAVLDATGREPGQQEPVAYDDPNVLCERVTAGLTVRVAHLPIMQLSTLSCELDGRSVTCTVPDDSVLDAFHHPVLYLNESQVAELGVS